jgi:hypothetical protein
MLPYRIWGSHGGEYEDGCLLGCSAVQSGRSLPSFHRVLTASIIALMMEAARTSETAVNFYQTTRRYNSEEAIFIMLPVLLYQCETWCLIPREKHTLRMFEIKWCEVGWATSVVRATHKPYITVSQPFWFRGPPPLSNFLVPWTHSLLNFSGKVYPLLSYLLHFD